MNAGGDAADELVKYYFEGIKVAAELSGKGAERVLALLIAKLNSKEKTKGKATLNAMLKQGKPLDIFTINKKDLPKFAREAKSYGILYSALINKHNKNVDDVVDIIVRKEDSPRINRIVKRFSLVTANTATIRTTIQNEIDKHDKEQQENAEKPADVTTIKAEEEKDSVKEKLSSHKEEKEANFNTAKTDQSPLSKPYSKKSTETKDLSSRKSVRAELNEIKDEMQKEKGSKAKEKVKVNNTKFKNAKVKKTRGRTK